MGAVTLLVIGGALVSLLLGIVIGVYYATDRATKGTTDLLLAALYLYCDKAYGPEWRADFIENVGEFMVVNEEAVKSLAKVLDAERKLNPQRR